MLIDAVEFAGEKSKWFEKGTSSKHAIFPGVLYHLSGVLYIAYAAVQIILIEPRLLLTEDLAYFGHGTFVEQLDEAYRAFTAFCKSKKIRHTQAPFTPKMVTWRCWKKHFYACMHDACMHACMARIIYYVFQISNATWKSIMRSKKPQLSWGEKEKRRTFIHSQSLQWPSCAFMVGAVYVTRGRNVSWQSNCGAYISCNELWLLLIRYISIMRVS